MGIALGAEFGKNVNRRNWWSFVGGHRNWTIWEIGSGRRIDLPPNSKAPERRQKYVKQEYGLLARSFCHASFCLPSGEIRGEIRVSDFGHFGLVFVENLNTRNWWSFVRGHRNWPVWEIGFGRRIDLPLNPKA